MNTQQSRISDFLSHKRLAVIGVSRDPKHFSRSLFHAFIARGFEAVPVNPATDSIDGHACFADIRSIDPKVEWVLLMTAKKSWLEQLQACRDAGITRVWLYGVTGSKEVPPEVAEFCLREEMETVNGHCPFMFLPDSPFFHRVHGFFWKMLGFYPK